MFKDDPPSRCHLANRRSSKALTEDLTHYGIMGVKLEERLRAVGVDVVLVHPDRPHPRYQELIGVF